MPSSQFVRISPSDIVDVVRAPALALDTASTVPHSALAAPHFPSAVSDIARLGSVDF